MNVHIRMVGCSMKIVLQENTSENLQKVFFRAKIQFYNGVEETQSILHVIGPPYYRYPRLTECISNIFSKL